MTHPDLPRSLPETQVRRVLTRVALLVLLVGVVTATCIWLSQDRAERQQRALLAKHPVSPNLLEPLPPDDSRRYTHDVELYYGKTGLLLDKATRWLDYLTHGKPLAWTVTVVSALVAGGVFWVGSVYRPRGGVINSG